MQTFLKDVDLNAIGGPVSRREGILLSVIVHLVLLIVLIVMPPLPGGKPNAKALLALQRAAQPPPMRFVYMAPRRDLEAKKAPKTNALSDKDRLAQTPLRNPNATNMDPYSRGRSPERVEGATAERQRSQGLPDSSGADPQARRSAQDQQTPQPVEQGRNAMLQVPPQYSRTNPSRTDAAPRGLGYALGHLDKYVDQENFGNQQGGNTGDVGGLQFDSKGVDFGKWIRRFVAQVRRNWVVPQLLGFHGHVVITFNVHKDGSLTDIIVIAPSPLAGLDNSAVNALMWSNPTEPLPPEYPDETCHFTGTFLLNETPPSYTPQ